MKKNNKNAFTLIELLAVIVILAIIALIATPIILGIVEDARKDSFMRSVELVIKTTDIDIFGKNYTDTYTYTIEDGVISNLDVGVKNTDGMNGSITYDKNGNDKYAIHNGKYCVIKEDGMDKAEIKDYKEGECELTNSTDASYFTYADILTDFRIVDVDACVDWFENDGATNEKAISMCNNEPQEWWDEMTLTEWANNQPLDYTVLTLIEEGVLTGTSTNNIMITGYSEEGPKDVIIPSKIKGKKVVIIGEEAFDGLELASVEIPNTVTIIEDGAFAVNNLTSIIIPSSVEYIGNGAFSANSLQEVTIPASVTYVEAYAFSGNVFKNVIIENDDIELGAGVFCVDLIEESLNSESYQKIYSINPSAFNCPD